MYIEGTAIMVSENHRLEMVMTRILVLKLFGQCCKMESLVEV